MSRKTLAILSGAVALTVGLTANSGFAATGGIPSIGVNFGANETGGSLAATDVAGVVPTANWNNASGQSGSLANLNADIKGAINATAATVTWNSNNTWASTG